MLDYGFAPPFWMKAYVSIYQRQKIGQKGGVCSSTCLPSRKKATHRQAGSEALQMQSYALQLQRKL